MIELLESRRLLSVTLDNGILRIIGRAGDDTLTIAQLDNLISPFNLIVTLNGDNEQFKRSDVDAVIIDLGGGDDTADCGDLTKPLILLGGDGNDTLTGGQANQLIVGGRGDDSISCSTGRKARNLVIGGAGDDTITATGQSLDSSDMNVIILCGAGDDTVQTSRSTDTIVGGEGDDHIDAGSGDDAIQGDAGNDTIMGGAGNDKINGGAGDDWLIGNAGNDTIPTGPGRDTIDGGSGNDVVPGAIFS
jgi:Ca2+-binding RTX toxin-like protein